MYLHYRNSRCPLCNMYTERLNEHLMLYHIMPSKKLLLERDLAILCKKAKSTKILRDKNLNLSQIEKAQIRSILKKL